MASHPAIVQAAQIVRESQRIVALTGAGISRPSGIPDFRSDAGLWQLDDPMEVASLHGFRANLSAFITGFGHCSKRSAPLRPTQPTWRWPSLSSSAGWPP